MSVNGGRTVAVIGAGAFGTALGIVAAADGERVLLVGRDAPRMAQVQHTRVHRQALAGVRLPDNLSVTADAGRLGAADIVLLAVPAQALADALRTHAAHLGAGATLVVCAKGIERTSGRLLPEVVAGLAQNRPVAALSGPGFAADMAAGLPTAMTIAAGGEGQAERLAARLSRGVFRLYASSDVTGVSVGGALKNVLAIACGIVAGLELGESARAALIARGLAEIMRFAVAHGGEARTVSGLSGLGDLVLTATGTRSRNLRFGLALGKGARPQALMTSGAPLCEGAFTAGIAARIGAEKGIDMPVVTAVADVIGGRVGVAMAVEALLARPLAPE